jgi:hypothetical protein
MARLSETYDAACLDLAQMFVHDCSRWALALTPEQIARRTEVTHAVASAIQRVIEDTLGEFELRDDDREERGEASGMPAGE